MQDNLRLPVIIQGGMGVAVSNWRLARAVSKYGELGVVSGTFVDNVVARRLQDGDQDGAVRRALANFPVREIADAIRNTYFIEGGKPADAPYKRVSMHGMKPQQHLIDLTVVANFVEVFLAKEGHKGLVGINYLTKIDLPTLPSLYGAMLASVDYVLMGAGIPRAIPGILDRLSNHEAATLKIDVAGATAGNEHEVTFDPSRYHTANAPFLKRPNFLAIVSSYTLALSLAKKASGKVDGFVIEHHSAGGHNAPPRGGITVDERGEPIYGPKDEVDLQDFTKLDLPFWVAGSCASPEQLQAAIDAGAQGIQVGTAFAYCHESGITEELKAKVLVRVLSGDAQIFTDPRASSSGYPFKVVQVEGSLSDPEIYSNRSRVCDLGYLRTAYVADNGVVSFRCPGEPIDDFLKKGGQEAETEGRKCLCNGLMSTVGLPQVQADGYVEPPLVTAGNSLNSIKAFIPEGKTSYLASDVLERLLGRQVKSIHLVHEGAEKTALR
jgi:nitronate monooxygenase